MFHLFLCFSHDFPIKTSIDRGFSHVFPGFSHGVWGFVDGMALEVAIVTGASRGIGAAIADALAKVFFFGLPFGERLHFATENHHF